MIITDEAYYALAEQCEQLKAALAQAQAEIARLKGEIDTLDELHKEKRVRLAAMERERDRECRRADGYMDWINECAKTLDGKSPLETKQQLAAIEKELHDAKTQCGKNAISHMTQYHRADSLQQQLQTAREQQARLREALGTVLKHLNTCLDDRDIDPDGPIGELYGMMHEWEDLVAQATSSGDAFDARAAVVELAEMVEASDRLRRLPLAGDVQRAVELKRKAKG